MSVLAQSRHMTKPISPRISLIVAGLLIVSMLVNGFVPRFAIDGSSRSVIASVLASNSLLLQYFSLSVLPLTIVNTLFQERASDPRPNTPQKQNERSSNSSSDYSLMNADGRLNQSRQELGCVPFPCLAMSAAFISFLVPEARAPDNRAVPLPVVIGSLLLCFFLLARSSVNEDAVMVRRVYSKTRFR